METLIEHSIREWRRTPEMRIQDAYKWLFHATLGGEHAVTDESFARAWLEQEWDEIGAPIEGESDFQKLTPSGELIRVNLRPYKARGGDKEKILEAFLLSAQQFRGERNTFIEHWKLLRCLLQENEIGSLKIPSWDELDAESERQNYPAMHHSAEYERAYRPAYRVVKGAVWSSIDR